MSELTYGLVVALAACLFGYFVAWRLQRPVRLSPTGSESKEAQAVVRDYGLTAQLELQFEKGKAEERSLRLQTINLPRILQRCSALSIQKEEVQVPQKSERSSISLTLLS